MKVTPKAKHFSEKEALEKLHRQNQPITFRENIEMYLKPQNSRFTALHLMMVVLDSMLSLVFIMGIVYHILEDEFKTLNDKVIECIIGIGLSLIALLYSYFDGSRFLESTFDRALYLISCII